MNDYNRDALQGCERCSGCVLLMALIVVVYTIVTSLAMP